MSFSSESFVTSTINSHNQPGGRPPCTQYVGSILKDVFLVFPQYCLGRGLMDMATEMNINLIVAKFGFISERNRYSWDFLGKYMACMVIQVGRSLLHAICFIRDKWNFN